MGAEFTPSSRFRRRASLVLCLALALAFAGLIESRSCARQRAATVAVLPSPASRVPTAGADVPPVEAHDKNPPVSSEPRLRALSFTIDASGIHLDQSVSAAGRVKAPPRSVAADRLEFEVHDETGRVVYAGSIDHPLHVVSEYEDPARPGTLRRRARDLDREVFQIRLPEPLAAREIAFFEVRAGAAPGRAALGVLTLR